MEDRDGLSRSERIQMAKSSCKANSTGHRGRLTAAQAEKAAGEEKPLPIKTEFLARIVVASALFLLLYGMNRLTEEKTVSWYQSETVKSWIQDMKPYEKATDAVTAWVSEKTGMQAKE